MNLLYIFIVSKGVDKNMKIITSLIAYPENSNLLS